MGMIIHPNIIPHPPPVMWSPHQGHQPWATMSRSVMSSLQTSRSRTPDHPPERARPSSIPSIPGVSVPARISCGITIRL